MTRTTFNSGDFVMDRDTMRMGVVVESGRGKTTVEWRNGATTTVKTSSVKG